MCLRVSWPFVGVVDHYYYNGDWRPSRAALGVTGALEVDGLQVSTIFITGIYYILDIALSVAYVCQYILYFWNWYIVFSVFLPLVMN